MGELCFSEVRDECGAFAKFVRCVVPFLASKPYPRVTKRGLICFAAVFQVFHTGKYLNVLRECGQAVTVPGAVALGYNLQ